MNFKNNKTAIISSIAILMIAILGVILGLILAHVGNTLSQNKSSVLSATDISSANLNLQPAPSVAIPKITTWQWQLTQTVDQSVDATLFNIDLFDNSQSVIASLKANNKIVICYFSAGSYENWRSDASSFPSSALGSQLDGWPNEKWLDIRQISQLAPIMTARMDLAKSKGCDGLEPDNIDGYINGSGFALTGADQIAYNKFIAAEAHKRGLLIGLKNDLDQIVELEPFFDFAVNEQCFQYNECYTYEPFLQAGKAVFNVEYNLNVSQFCSQANALGIMAMKKNLDLDASRTVCWTATIPPRAVISSTVLTLGTTAAAPITGTISTANLSPISLVGANIPNGMAATFSPAGGGAITGIIQNSTFVPAAGQIIATNSTTGPATGILAVSGANLVTIATNFVLQVVPNSTECNSLPNFWSGQFVNNWEFSFNLSAGGKFYDTNRFVATK